MGRLCQSTRPSARRLLRPGITLVIDVRALSEGVDIVKCVYCGSEVAEGAKFCTECGKPLAASIADDGVSAGDATQNSLENSGMETQLAESVQDEPQPEKKEEKEKEIPKGIAALRSHTHPHARSRLSDDGEELPAFEIICQAERQIVRFL